MLSQTKRQHSLERLCAGQLYKLDCGFINTSCFSTLLKMLNVPLAPLVARPWAIIHPMPVPPPVTSATLPFKSYRFSRRNEAIFHEIVSLVCARPVSYIYFEGLTTILAYLSLAHPSPRVRSQQPETETETGPWASNYLGSRKPFEVRVACIKGYSFSTGKMGTQSFRAEFRWSCDC